MGSSGKLVAPINYFDTVRNGARRAGALIKRPGVAGSVLQTALSFIS